MSKKAQRDLFLLLTIMGTFLTLLLIAYGAFLALDEARELATDIRSGGLMALATRTKQIVPVSLVGSIVVIGTFVSYRRYHKLAFPHRK